MSAELHQKAKSLFQELLDLPKAECEQRLSQLDSESPELAREVRSLLTYHTAQSLLVTPSPPKIKTRSTLSTTVQASSLRWLVAPSKGLLVAIPLIVIGILLIGWTYDRVTAAVHDDLAVRLDESLSFRMGDFQRWEQATVARSETLAQIPSVRNAARQLVEVAQNRAPHTQELVEALSESTFGSELAQALGESVGPGIHFRLFDRRLLLVKSSQDDDAEMCGEFPAPNVASVLGKVLQGQPRLHLTRLDLQSPPAPHGAAARLEPSLLVPLAGDQPSDIIGVLQVQDATLRAELQSMLDIWGTSAHGEVLFVGKRGELLASNRASSERATALENAPAPAESSAAFYVRDPGIDLRERTTEQTPDSWPPTLLAQQLMSGGNGYNLEGYRNYLGQTVIGAWRWLPDHDLGIGLEIPDAEAFALANVVRTSLSAAVALFAIGLISMFVVVAVGSLSKRRLRDISEVGPYQVQELLGEGGMGQVYLAEHALLCRQSAVKVLTKDVNDLTVISRFEREVQLASQLTHPNTISIFDFGRNRDGIFYYAMEYIDGAHLGQLVEYTGPIAPGRCIYILRQLCRALNEAHRAGVVHRDIKPQNVMVCNRGGEPDFVKLFDYGLVKAFVPGVADDPSQTKVVVGTPRFMAPERLNSPWLADPRVDVYSVGALAYYLLTARLPPLVTPSDSLAPEQTGVETLDLPPAVVAFGGLLSICLSVEPAARPSNMSSLTRELDELSRIFPWEREDSVEWWDEHEPRILQLVREKRKDLVGNNRVTNTPN